MIAETSEAYSVQVKRNGATVKSWADLTGEQNLSWDGKQNGQVLSDGNYRIVAMTEKQRDRVRDDQIVVLDKTAPEIKKAKIRKKNGKYELNLNITESGSGVAQETFVLSFKGGNASSFAGTSVFNSDKKLFTYTFNSATFEDIRSLSNGQVSALLNLGDKVGNHILNRKVPLSDSVCIGTGIETTSIEIDETDFSFTYKGTVFGISDSFDPNTIFVDYGTKMSLSEQSLMNFSRTNHPEGCQTGDFEIKASDIKMNLSENLPDLNIEETNIRAEFTEIEPSELILMANNFMGFGIANVGPTRISEKIQCKTSQLLCQTELESSRK